MEIDNQIDLIERKAGKENKYQYAVLFIAFLFWSNYFLIIANSPFLEEMPRADYTDEKGNIFKDTKLTNEICKDQSKISAITYKPGYSISCEFNFYCDSVAVGAMNGIYFGGVIFGQILLSFINKALGRKKTLILNCVINLLISVIITFMPNKELIFVCIFLYNASAMLICQTGILFAQEVVVNSKRALFSSTVNLGYILGIMMYISSFVLFDSWKVSFYLSAGISVFMIAYIHYFVIESSKTYLREKNYKLFLISLLKVAIFNNKKEEFLTCLTENNENFFDKNSSNPEINFLLASSKVKITDKENINTNNDFVENTLLESEKINFKMIRSYFDNDNEEKQASPLDIFKYKSQRYKFMRFCCVWFLVLSMYFGNTVNIKNLPGSIIVNGLINGLIETFGILSSNYLMDIIGRKKVILINFFVSSILLSIFVIFELGDTTIIIISNCVKVLLSGSLNTLYAITGESYPNKIKNIAFSFNNSFGKFGALILTFTLELITPFQLNLTFLTFGLLGVVLVLFIDETLGKNLQSTIPEEVENKNETAEETAK